ncbi:MAG: helix-turn-helix transcriptional regulator [Selenomonadaceae bacterium]|nr:helix-turn-helix transcriptional regulator [Selenomonadaceae bacterium]
MSIKSLRELERDGLISKKILKEDPPKEIVYSLTEEGLNLMPAMNKIYTWELKHMELEK